MSQPTWLITGASSGLGLVLCLRVLKAGHKVVGSVRSKTKSAGAVAQIEQAGGTVIELDIVESKESITKKVQAVGDIDYLVNNAGYSILAACEDITYVAKHSTRIFDHGGGHEIPRSREVSDAIASLIMDLAEESGY